MQSVLIKQQLEYVTHSLQLKLQSFVDPISALLKKQLALTRFNSKFVTVMIVNDSERDHTMGSPVDGTLPRCEDLIEIVTSKTICAVTVRRPLKRPREWLPLIWSSLSGPRTVGGLPMLWFRSLSFAINKCTQQSNTHFIVTVMYISNQSSCKWSTLNTSLPVWRTGTEGTAVQQRSVCGCLPLDTQTCHLWLGPAMQSGTWTRGKPWRESPLWTEAGFEHSHTRHPL